MAMFYKAVLQAVMIYGSEIWVITYSMMKVLKGFHHQINQSIMGKIERNIRMKGWEWIPVEGSLYATVLGPLQGYVRWYQETIEE